MSTWLKQGNEKLLTLNQREKILLLFAGLILLPGIIDFFLIQPLRDQSNQWQKQTQAINQRLSSFSQQQKDLLLEIENDPAMGLERRIEGIAKALNSTKDAMLSYTDTLISPQKMASMLESMLHERGSLELISLENLPVTPLFNQADNQQKKASESEQVADVFGLYRHGIQLVFKGDYMNSMDYLKSLEQMPWKFYWQHFNYEVQKYPTALITLNIYTLSTSDWWIGDDDEP